MVKVLFYFQRNNSSIFGALLSSLHLQEFPIDAASQPASIAFGKWAGTFLRTKTWHLALRHPGIFWDLEKTSKRDAILYHGKLERMSKN